MVSPENRTGLYIAIPLYFAVLCIITLFSYRRAKRLEKNQENDKMVGHFLGGRSLGPFITGATIFASLFSGYTVVGVPNESFRHGFYGFRWLASFPYIIYGYVCTGVRLRKASLVRNHHTPLDFVTDRYRSQLLRYTIFTIQILASFVYLSAQVNSLQSTFNSMFGFDPSEVWPVVVIMAIILVFEWAGGLAVVALSDAVQGVVMLISFLCLPLLILGNYGGWNDIDPSTYDRPDFYQTPSSDDQWLFWQFSLINICIFTLPHLLQRLYSARDLSSLKVGFVVNCIGAWATLFVGLFVGTMGVFMGVPSDVPNPFTAIIEQIMALGGFAEVIGVIALTASLAGIMSTADSLLIAVSQLVTVEIIWPWQPTASQNQLVWAGRSTSLFSVIMGLIIGTLWKGGVAALAAINFPIMIQAVPTFLIGLYAKDNHLLHPWSLTIGSIIALIYVFGFFFGYRYLNSESRPINAGISGVLLNIIVSYLIDVFWMDRSKLHRWKTSKKKEKNTDDHDQEEVLSPSPVQRPKWDVPCCKRFGESKLTNSLLNEAMEGFPEPIRSTFFNIFFFMSVSIITPLVAEGQPVINADTGKFLSDPPIVNGLPWWFMKQIVLAVIPFAVMLKVIYDIPNEYPFDTDKIDREGVDPEILELTQKELNFRFSFDEPNASILKRRSIVSAKMDALGMTSPSKDKKKDGPVHNLPNSSRLSLVIRKEAKAHDIQSNADVTYS